jgi:hypothetical protein
MRSPSERLYCRHTTTALPAASMARSGRGTVAGARLFTRAIAANVPFASRWRIHTSSPAPLRFSLQTASTLPASSMASRGQLNWLAEVPLAISCGAPSDMPFASNPARYSARCPLPG